MGRKFSYLCAGLLCVACGLTPASDLLPNSDTNAVSILPS
jgi:hypothetical protein